MDLRIRKDYTKNRKILYEIEMFIWFWNVSGLLSIRHVKLLSDKDQQHKKQLGEILYQFSFFFHLIQLHFTLIFHRINSFNQSYETKTSIKKIVKTLNRKFDFIITLTPFCTGWLELRCYTWHACLNLVYAHRF